MAQGLEARGSRSAPLAGCFCNCRLPIAPPEDGSLQFTVVRDGTILDKSGSGFSEVPELDFGENLDAICGESDEHGGVFSSIPGCLEDMQYPGCSERSFLRSLGIRDRIIGMFHWGCWLYWYVAVESCGGGWRL